MRMMTVDSSSDEGSDTYSDCEFMSPVQKKRMRRMSRTLKWVYKDTKQKESMKSFMERAHEENNDEKTEKSIATEVNALPLMELNQSVKTLYTSEKADVLGPILQSEPYKAVTTSGRVKNPFTLTDYYDDISDDSMQSYNSNHDEDSDDQKVIMDEAEDSHDQKMIMDEAEDSHDQTMIMDEDESSEDDDQKVVIDEDEYAVEFLGAGRVINPFTLSDYYEDISDASMDTSNSELFTSEHEDLSAEGSDDQDIIIIDVDDDSGEDAGDEIIVIDDDDDDEDDNEDEDDDEDDVNDDDEDDDDSGDQIVIIEEHED